MILILNFCRAARVAWLSLGLLALGLATPAPAAAQGVYFSTESVLREMFKSSTEVSFVRLAVGADRTSVESACGHPLPKDAYVLYVAKSGEVVDGYALIDDEVGQHLPITFAVQVSPSLEVVRSEVMVYREAYGSQIRLPRFTAQLHKKSLDSPLRLDDDVAVISGATLSAQSMLRVVKRALALTELHLTRQKHEASNVDTHGALR